MRANAAVLDSPRPTTRWTNSRRLRRPPASSAVRFSRSFMSTTLLSLWRIPGGRFLRLFDRAGRDHRGFFLPVSSGLHSILLGGGAPGFGGDGLRDGRRRARSPGDTGLAVASLVEVRVGRHPGDPEGPAHPFHGPLDQEGTPPVKLAQHRDLVLPVHELDRLPGPRDAGLDHAVEDLPDVGPEDLFDLAAFLEVAEQLVQCLPGLVVGEDVEVDAERADQLAVLIAEVDGGGAEGATVPGETAVVEPVGVGISAPERFQAQVGGGAAHLSSRDVAVLDVDDGGAEPVVGLDVVDDDLATRADGGRDRPGDGPQEGQQLVHVVDPLATLITLPSRHRASIMGCEQLFVKAAPVPFPPGPTDRAIVPRPAVEGGAERWAAPLPGSGRGEGARDRARAPSAPEGTGAGASPPRAPRTAGRGRSLRIPAAPHRRRARPSAQPALWVASAGTTRAASISSLMSWLAKGMVPARPFQLSPKSRRLSRPLALTPIRFLPPKGSGTSPS